MLPCWIFLTTITALYLHSVLPDKPFIEQEAELPKNSGGRIHFPSTNTQTSGRGEAKNFSVQRATQTGANIKKKKMSDEDRKTNAKKSPQKRISAQNIPTINIRNNSNKHMPVITGKDQKEWYVAFFRNRPNMAKELQQCGSKEHPCNHVQTVMDKIQEGDTVLLTQDIKEENRSKEETTSHANTEQGQIAKFNTSFKLKSDPKTNSGKHTTTAHSVHFRSTTSEALTIVIESTTFQNIHITIKEASLFITSSLFVNSSLYVASLNNSCLVHIRGSEFLSNSVTTLNS